MRSKGFVPHTHTRTHTYTRKHTCARAHTHKKEGSFNFTRREVGGGGVGAVGCFCEDNGAKDGVYLEETGPGIKKLICSCHSFHRFPHT